MTYQHIFKIDIILLVAMYYIFKAQNIFRRFWPWRQ